LGRLAVPIMTGAVRVSVAMNASYGTGISMLQAIGGAWQRGAGFRVRRPDKGTLLPVS